jgi:DNA mismatch repair protein MutS2
VIYPQTFENKIGFDRIRQMLIELCLCELGREKVEQIRFNTSFQSIIQLLQLTSEMKIILMFEENFPEDNYIDGRRSIAKVKIEGACPEVEDLVILGKSLQSIIQLSKFFSGSEKKNKYPALCELASGILTFPQVVAEIERIIDKSNKVKDTASPELKEIRQQIRQKQTEVNRRLIQLLKQAKADGIAEEDAEITFRDNRPVIPVSAANKRKLGGMVHDESATGKTAFVEPSAVVELNNKVRELQIAEEREIRKILLAFADFVRPFMNDIFESYNFLAEVDFTRAKAKFASHINGTHPILQETCNFSWRNAIHPLLFLAHKKEKKEVVPLNIHLNSENRILVISGPNAGGKSVCLKTVGLLQYMLQCGMLVPMGENSEAGIFNSIFIDIGDEQSIDNDLSTYSGHLENMKFFVKRSDEKTLILIDEFGTGTEPALGGAIAEAVLEKIHQLKAFGVITTHYANLKHFASETPGIMNGAMLFDTQSIKPLFQLTIGKPGSSFAIDIARKIGLPEEILSKATEKVGEEHFNYDKQLREIARDKTYWETKRQKIRKVEKTLDDLYEKYHIELEDIQKERKKILAEAKAEAQSILKGSNAAIERIIREIREAQADKDKTKLVRENLERVKAEFEKNTFIIDKFEKKKTEIVNAGKNLEKYSPEIEKSKVNIKKTEKKIELKPGDMVQLKGLESKGEIVKIEGKHVTLMFGNMLSTVEIDKIQISDSQEKPKTSSGVKIDQAITSKKLNFKSDLDVRGQRADDALMNVQQFLDEAVMSGSRQLSILHGKGNGILRQLIREYLATLSFVKSFNDAHADRGGAGITHVVLDY